MPDAAEPHGEWQARALSAGAAGTWEWDRGTGIVEWDPALEALYGLEPGSFGGSLEDWLALVHPGDRDEVLARLEETIASSSGHFLLFRAVRPDGAVRWIESRGRVRRTADGEVLGIAGVCHDVTDRHVAERKLWALEQRARERLEFLA